jgi:hypothetical protein
MYTLTEEETDKLNHNKNIDILNELIYYTNCTSCK